MARITRRYFYIKCNHLSDKGFDRAVELYRLRQSKYPKYIGGNYKMASSIGYIDAAERILCDIDGCNQLDFLEGYLYLKDINGN